MQKELQIPEFYKNKLKDSSALNADVFRSVNIIGTWLEQNKMKFFDGYTDHSLIHIEQILSTSVDLIRTPCIGYISDKDSATFIIAVLLHDAAMHLTFDGFIDLVTGDYKNNIVEGFGDKKWAELWQDFIVESRRFSSRKIISIFGDPEPVDPPDLKKKNPTEKQLLLVGEFLRRHHHRLAHEIALYGVPGPTKTKLKLDLSDDTKHIADIAGLVARSHGMDMRDCVKYLEDKYSTKREQRGIHTVFLMSLLRVSDILQIQPGRAPLELNKTRELRSPISKLEHQVHQAIKTVNLTEYLKSETIFVESQPDENKIYLKAKKLLENIQKELDYSWIILGEVYAFDDSLKEFGFKYRRVISNLDDVDKFSKSINYIPVKAAFEAADSDLLKLLIEPLYGDIPGVGVRELLQNSVDAVREIREYLKNNPEIRPDFPDLEGDIVISIDKDENSEDYWFKIEDKGIGMSMDVITQYFLKAGASFRRSDLWKRNFEDKDGKSNILRSGRFGIGVLAAYLLGDEITVSTRYLNDICGVIFSTKLEEEEIDFKKIDRPIGTSIIIKLTQNAVQELISEYENDKNDNWDWYCLNDIIVVRKINNNKLKQKILLPAENSSLPIGWHRIKHSNFKDIQWNYFDDSQIFCNGIIVTGSSEYNLDFLHDDSLTLPSLSVFDNNSLLPLNLQRTDLTTNVIPFEKELEMSVIKDLIAYLLVNLPSKYFPKTFRFQYPGLYLDSSSWIKTKEGVLLNIDPWFIWKSKLKTILNIYSSSESFSGINSKIKKQVKNSNYVGFCYEHIHNTLKANSYNFHYFIKILNDIIEKEEGASKRILIHKSLTKFSSGQKDRHRSKYKSQFDKSILELTHKLKLESENENWGIWTKGNCPNSSFDFIKFAHTNNHKLKDIEKIFSGIMYEAYYNDIRPVKISNFADIWSKYLKDSIIPLNMNERKKKFNYAFIKLKKLIVVQEEIKDRKLYLSMRV